LIRLTVNFLVFSLLVAALPFWVGFSHYSAMLVPKFWVLYLFYFLITYIVCSVVVLGQKQGDKPGAQLFLIATTIKLLACMIFALIYVRYMPINASRFIICFFYLYFLNTAFEIYTLISNLRIQNKK
jgi:hypothetical protein